MFNRAFSGPLARFVLAMLLLASLYGCGQKGPLELPEPQQDEEVQDEQLPGS